MVPRVVLITYKRCTSPRTAAIITGLIARPKYASLGLVQILSHAEPVILHLDVRSSSLGCGTGPTAAYILLWLYSRQSHKSAERDCWVLQIVMDCLRHGRLGPASAVGVGYLDLGGLRS